jgi:hypothetical protein
MRTIVGWVIFSRLIFLSSKDSLHQQNQVVLNDLTQPTNFLFSFTPKMISTQFPATLIIPLYLTFVKYFFMLISIIRLFENFSIEIRSVIRSQLTFRLYREYNRARADILYLRLCPSWRHRQLFLRFHVKFLLFTAPYIVRGESGNEWLITAAGYQGF